MHIRLNAVERNVPEVRCSSARPSGHRRDRLLVALLELAERTIRIRCQQPDEILVERDCPDYQSLELEPDCDIVLPESSEPDGDVGATGRVVCDRCEATLAGCGGSSAGARHQ